MSKLGLSRTPPLDVPLRFLLTAPLFGVAAAALLAWGGGAGLAGRWSPLVLAFTHLLSLGFLGMVMVGALFQVFPVVLGTSLPGGRRVTGLVHVGLTLGATLLAAGLLRPGFAWIMATALALLGGAVTLFLVVATLGLARAEASDTLRLAVGAALLALAATLVLGMLLGAGHGGIDLALDRRWTDLHALWGLLGWVGLLVVGLAYEVVPLFQMTPAYPDWLRRRLSAVLLVALLLWSLGFAALRLGGPAGWGLALWVGGLGLGLGFAVFAGVTLRLQIRRQRRDPDLTVWYWRTAMSCLVAGVSVGTSVLALGLPPAWLMVAGALILVGFGVSAIAGMLYKILPFLVWLHLTRTAQAQGLSRRVVPPIKEMIPAGPAWAQYLLHLVGLTLLCAALVRQTDPLARAAALALGSAFALLGWNLLSALRRYLALWSAWSAVSASDGPAGGGALARPDCPDPRTP
jgi:succinate dehydrogenase hydrophobic anchor subunit